MTRCVAQIVVGLCASLCAGSALAHWKPQYANAPHKDFYESAHDCGGGSCCGDADASPFYDGYQINKDGSVTIGKRVVPKCGVILTPNPTGHAVIWKSPGGEVIYCFAPGTGS